MNGRAGLPGFTRRALLVGGVGAVAAGTGDGVSAAEADPPGLFVLGDSWAAGLHADPRHALGQTAARLLGWPVEVDAVSGTGYLAGTAAGPAYPVRLQRRAPDRSPGVAVVQGGSNDHGRPAADLAAAVDSTVRRLRLQRPRHRILLLGPGPDPEPVTPAQRAVDDVLADAARRLRVPYVSMLRQGWITPEHADEVLDPGNHHPTARGQAYLGRRLAAAVRTRFPDLAS